MNALHARFDPRGVVGMAAFALLFFVVRVWIGGWILVARAALWFRGLKQLPRLRAAIGAVARIAITSAANLVVSAANSCGFQPPL